MNKPEILQPSASPNQGWTKPELTIISVNNDTLAGGSGLDDGEFGLS